jgi:transcriptional antiterminator NusG
MASEDKSGTKAPEATTPPPTTTATDGAKLKWYVVHTYSGHENKARLSLQERVKQMGMDKSFGQVLIPTESVLEMVKGQKRTTTRKFYPGYMFVQMELNEATYHLVKNTPKITGFLGGTNPTPVPEKDIAAINTQMSEGAVKPKPRVSFEQNENVRVIDGPFANFSGIVEEVKPEKQKVRVLVSIFGRATPVELDFAQVEKA